jgi:hypothetical protein
MADHVYIEIRKPSWWTEQHAADWDRVKGALQRDWEQTKADFSIRSGENLNQSVSDTVMQAAGATSLPPVGVRTHESGPKAATKEASRARGEAERESARAAEISTKAQDAIQEERVVLGEKVSDARERLADELGQVTKQRVAAHLREGDSVAAARGKAAGGIAKEHEKVERANARREAAIERWKDAEEVVRYGYSVRSQYPATYVWDERLEGSLKGEWEKLDPGMSWRISRSGIRRGWDFADQKK